MKKLLILTIFLYCTTSHAAEERYLRFSKLVLIKGEVNGIKGHFFLDSGAPGCIINSDVVTGLKGESAEANGTSGVMKVKKTILKSIKFKGRSMSNVRAIFQPMNGFTRGRKDITFLGLIGYDQLKGYVLTINYQMGTYDILKADAWKYDGKANVVPFSMRGHLPIIGVDAQGTKINMALDTGAESNMLDKTLFEKLKTKLARVRKVQIIGGNGRPVTVKAGNLASTIGSKKYKGMPTAFRDLSSLRKKIGQSVDGIIGYALFKQAGKIAISYPANKLYLWTKKTK